MVERELVPADSAEVTLLAGMSVAVFDDRDGTAVRTVKLVHGLFNPHRAQESTTTGMGASQNFGVGLGKAA